MSKATITFEGLMIFHQDVDGFYELGILNAQLIGHHHSGSQHTPSVAVPLHEFRIDVTPDPLRGTGTWKRGPSDLEPFLTQSNRWSLEVKDAKGNLETGISADESLPDRHSLEVADKKFGWIINLESSEFHNQLLDRESGKFRPIIRLSKGNLYTFCKTGGLNVLKNAKQDFGFAAGVLVLTIDNSAGETVTLKADGGDTVFSLLGGSDHRVDISNSTADTSGGSHFHVYYDQIFTSVMPEDRIDFEGQENVTHPDQCPKPLVVSVFPYRCGGLLINKGGDPLS